MHLPPELGRRLMEAPGWDRIFRMNGRMVWIEGKRKEVSSEVAMR
jgi:hypothetical protein